MKKLVFTISLFFFAFVTFCFYSVLTVHSATSDAYTIFTNPGEYADSDMNVAWQTDVKNTESYLIYTKKTDTTWANAVKVIPTRTVCSTFVTHTTIDENGNEMNQGNYLRCVASLTDLESDTEYMYKVGQTVMSDVHYFKTGGASEYSCALISDFHSHLSYPARTPAAMGMIDLIEEKSGSIDFILDAGDTVHIGGCNNFYKRNAEEENYKDYFWAGVIGNHDNRDWDNTTSTNTLAFFRDTHAYPTNGPSGEEGVCYYFIYSDTLFIMMDSVHTTSSNLKQMQAWAQEVIDNNPTRYIIFVQHYAWFEINNASDTQYKRWYEFFDKNHIDLAITGHHHIYTRTDALVNGEKDTNGTVYLVTACSDNQRGRGSYLTGDISEYASASDLEKSLVAYYYTNGSKTVGGILLDVDKNGMYLKLYNNSGTLLDSITITPKREVLSLPIDEKEKLKDETTYVQNATGLSSLVLPTNLYSYASSYEIYDQDSLIYSSTFKNRASRFAKVNLTKGTTKQLTVKIKFKDESIYTYSVNVQTNQNDGFLSNVHGVDQLLSWQVDDPTQQIALYQIYDGDTLVGESDKNSFVLTNSKVGHVYTIKAYDNKNIELDSITYKYGTLGDLNQDGLVDEKDVKIIQKYINGEIEFDEGLFSCADLNNDNKVNVQDAAYIKLYQEKLLTHYALKTYTVDFLGANGEVIYTVNVNEGEDATPTYLENYNYEVVSWIGDYHEVKSDLTIDAIYAKK